MRDVATLQQAGLSSDAAKVLRLAGVSAREAGRRMTRSLYLMALSFHSSHEVPTGPGEAMLVCRTCRPVKAWPCEQYERAERGLAEAS